jgi:hypothetical protein
MVERGATVGAMNLDFVIVLSVGGPRDEDCGGAERKESEERGTPDVGLDHRPPPTSRMLPVM